MNYSSTGKSTITLCCILLSNNLKTFFPAFNSKIRNLFWKFPNKKQNDAIEVTYNEDN